MRFLLTLLALTIFISPAFAQDAAKKQIDDIVENAAEEKTIEDVVEEAAEETEEVEDTSVRYAPKTCDFEITFPEEPYLSKRCPPNVNKCYQITGYTMVYDMSTTVDFSVTCVPSKPANYDRYDDRAIRVVLDSMVKRAEVEEYNINTQEMNGYRQGSLIGTGKYGRQSRIYNAQLWVGQNSVMTIEAKLTGPSHPQADEVFSDILASIQKKKVRKVKETSEEDEEESEED